MGWQMSRRGSTRRAATVATVPALGPATVVPTAQAAPGQAAEREWLDIDVVAEDGTVYVGTRRHVGEPHTGPSTIFAYEQSGELRREYVIEGVEVRPDGGAGELELFWECRPDPASVAFSGDRVPVTNRTPFLGGPASWGGYDVHAGERGRSEFRPQVR